MRTNIQACFIVFASLAVVGIDAELNNNQFLNYDENETAVQLKLFDNPIRLDGNAQYAGSQFQITMQYFQATRPNQSWRSDNITVSQLLPDKSRFVSMDRAHYSYVLARQNPMVTFFVNTTTPESTHYRFVITKAGEKTSEFHATIAPFQADETSGVRNVTIFDAKLNIPIGDIRVLFLVIRPCKTFRNGPTAYDVQPDNGDTNLTLMGHRGTGVSVRKDLPQKFIENTIDAFNWACDHGADMIELDVQLTSDGIPVIYHDFAVTTFIPTRKHHNSSSNFTFQIPLKDLSKRQLDMINTNFMPSLHREKAAHQSFETLEDVLKQIRPKCGINVEIKYPQIFEDGLWDGERGVELNKYVDTILTVLNEYHGNRKIVITSFHPDLCVMVQLKQRRFQVAFLTNGDRAINNPKARWIWDPRSHTVDMNVAFAVSANFYGLSLLTLDVQKHPDNIAYIRDHNLALYLWGDQIKSWQQIKTLFNARVNGFIFDHLDKIVPQHR